MRRAIQFVQLPIPPAGPAQIIGNIPLAAGYLILFARNQGLAEHFDFEIVPNSVVDEASDLALVQHLCDSNPWMVAFTCYLWNIDRTLWVAQQIKQRNPHVKIVVGGPEVTADNDWVLNTGVIDYAVVGEGEQTFSQLPQKVLIDSESTLPTSQIIPGLWQASCPQIPIFRKPLADLNCVSSPYLAGILDAGEQRMMLLETIRGCVFKCKFCYYPKSYDALYFVSEEKIVANLQHARERGAHEVILLDPTLNQRKDFDGFLQLLARENHGQQFEYFGELRAEGIKPETARLLREANFTEVEIGLQSVDPTAQTMMDRRNNLKAFERGVAAMIEAGLNVKVDLIIGLPGDTVSSVRRGFDYLASSELFSTVQVFNLAILPGTAFRQEAAQLGLFFQDRPPYYVLETPTLKTGDLYQLMDEAQEVFESEWDPFPEPRTRFDIHAPYQQLIHVDLNRRWSVADIDREYPPNRRAQALTIWLSGAEFRPAELQLIELLQTILQHNPHSTLQVVIEPTAEPTQVYPALPGKLLSACYQRPNYLDRYYSLNPNGNLGSKRILLLLSSERWRTLPNDWLQQIGESATVMYHGSEIDHEQLDYFEMAIPSQLTGPFLRA